MRRIFYVNFILTERDEKSNHDSPFFHSFFYGEVLKFHQKEQNSCQKQKDVIQ